MGPPGQVQGCGAGVRSVLVVSCIVFGPSDRRSCCICRAPPCTVVSAALNVISMYHDTLLAQFVQSDPKYKALIPPSPHTRYTRAWSDKDWRYKWAARTLQLVRFVELLIEMGLRRKTSTRNRWRGIVSLEVIKYASPHAT